jgi:hypothetical protein
VRRETRQGRRPTATCACAVRTANKAVARRWVRDEVHARAVARPRRDDNDAAATRRGKTGTQALVSARVRALGVPRPRTATPCARHRHPGHAQRRGSDRIGQRRIGHGSLQQNKGTGVLGFSMVGFNGAHGTQAAARKGQGRTAAYRVDRGRRGRRSVDLRPWRGDAEQAEQQWRCR